jgi:hypothetical protein
MIYSDGFGAASAAGSAFFLTAGVPTFTEV